MTPVFRFGAPYLPGLSKALHAVQDADGCLLGLQVPGRSQDRLSEAMHHHREAALCLQRLGGRP